MVMVGCPRPDVTKLEPSQMKRLRTSWLRWNLSITELRGSLAMFDRRPRKVCRLGPQSRETVEQRRLARIGIADDGDNRNCRRRLGGDVRRCRRQDRQLELIGQVPGDAGDPGRAGAPGPAA